TLVQLVVDGVALVGPVEGHDRDPVLDLDLEVVLLVVSLVVHAASSLEFARCYHGPPARRSAWPQRASWESTSAARSWCSLSTVPRSATRRRRRSWSACPKHGASSARGATGASRSSPAPARARSARARTSSARCRSRAARRDRRTSGKSACSRTGAASRTGH